jgi:hypothetical protein
MSRQRRRAHHPLPSAIRIGAGSPKRARRTAPTVASRAGSRCRCRRGSWQLAQRFADDVTEPAAVLAEDGPAQVVSEAVALAGL